MQNYQEWFSIKELMEKRLYLPSSDKGIVKKAAREGWKKRQREGVKGRTFEYHYSSFPVAVQKQLGLYDENNPVNTSTCLNDIDEKTHHYSTQLQITQAINTAQQIQIPVYHHLTTNCFKHSADDYIGLNPQWLSLRGITPNQLVFVIASGDSMQPTIHSGDILLINRAITTPKDGEIYLMRFGKQIWIKRIQGVPNGIRLISDNQIIYPPIELNLETADNFEIIGRIVFIGHHLI
ncbi:helix-turn-helix domain-containing protein [Pasteurella canis]|uniref:helix-turn-helix domain-containing protein n=1 Tax=Pasteurella canis TaxID=753 RepID=UPI000D89C886|nr:helix-turn-helix transcriptional regulator [Pasteurella canis]SPY33386.1 putative bacteriophage transcriptional regulator [Pasteurella canis]